MIQYKRKSGYRLKKGASGEMRWHKDEKFTRALDKQLSTAGATSSGHAKALQLFPGMKQASFKRSGRDLMLDTTPREFYGDSILMPTPSQIKSDHRPFDIVYHGTRSNFDKFADSPFDREFGTNTMHWNNGLGNHFTPNYDVAESFTTTRKDENQWPPAQDEKSRIIPVRLGIKNPLIANSESSIDQIAGMYALLNLTKKERDTLAAESPAYAEMFKIVGYDGLDFIDKYDLVKQLGDDMTSAAGASRSLMTNINQVIARRYSVDQRRVASKKFRLPARDDGAITYNPPTFGQQKILEKGMQFRNYLKRIGYDGVIYKNDREGGIGITPLSNSSIQYAEPDSTDSVMSIMRRGHDKGRHAQEHNVLDMELAMLADDKEKLHHSAYHHPIAIRASKMKNLVTADTYYNNVALSMLRSKLKDDPEIMYELQERAMGRRR